MMPWQPLNYRVFHNSLYQSNEFSLNRSLLEGRKFCKDGFEKVKLPDAVHTISSIINTQNTIFQTNALRWCEICFEKKPTEFRINPEYEKFFSLHKGIPPTLNFVKSLSDNTINHLILHQISVSLSCCFLNFSRFLVHIETWSEKSLFTMVTLNSPCR